MEKTKSWSFVCEILYRPCDVQVTVKKLRQPDFTVMSMTQRWGRVRH